MKQIVHHSVYGEIVYNENLWSGKKALTVNGLNAQPLSKNEVMVNGEKAVLKGNYLIGVSVCIGSETIEVLPKLTWYEIIVAFLPAVFILIWGNIPSLAAVFPVVGGAVGGGIGGLGTIASMLLMRKATSPIKKIIIGLGTFAVTVLAAFVMAIAIIPLAAQISFILQ